MTRDLHIAVFAKAPVAGQCKTRLIPLLGPDGAMRAHCAMTLHVLQIASAVAPGDVSLWSAGDHAHPFLHAAGARVGARVSPQCEGDLGQRMAHCLTTLLAQHRRVLLIGSDCPALSVTDLQDAASALQGARMVWVPSEDGGYVLIGATADAEGEALRGVQAACSAIDWSTASVMAQTRQRLAPLGWSAGTDWIELPPRWDVDEPADYLRAVRTGLLAPEPAGASISPPP